ncbi:hypothetical protein Hanom_Chr06g00579091 [Helianthus anomalus]
MACETSQRRGVAMVLAMVTAVVLSPLYVNKETHLETNSGFVLPMLLLGLIVAIKSASSLSSSSSSSSSWGEYEYDSSSSSWMLGIGSSSWALAGILGMLLFVLYWQNSIQHLFWR